MLVIRITQLQDLVEMSDGEVGSATTPGAEKLVKFANPTQVGAMFPALQSGMNDSEILTDSDSDSHIFYR